MKNHFWFLLPTLGLLWSCNQASSEVVTYPSQTFTFIAPLPQKTNEAPQRSQTNPDDEGIKYTNKFVVDLPNWQVEMSQEDRAVAALEPESGCKVLANSNTLSLKSAAQLSVDLAKALAEKVIIVEGPGDPPPNHSAVTVFEIPGDDVVGKMIVKLFAPVGLHWVINITCPKRNETIMEEVLLEFIDGSYIDS